MKIAKILILPLALLVMSCSNEAFLPEEGVNSGAQVVFSIGIADEPAVRSVEPEKIAGMHCVIADASGTVINPVHQKFEEDFSKFTVEGLGFGDYTVAFLAVPDDGRAGQVTEPEMLSDVWLANEDGKVPLDEIYFYSKVQLHIAEEQLPMTLDVSLERCVGRVDVDINMTSDYMWRFVRKVEVTLDGNDAVYSGMCADGSYCGEAGVVSYDVTESLSFCSLPSVEAVSGFVSIESCSSDGTVFERRYRFTDCKIEAGKVAHISIDYLHPENREGLIYIREEDFPRFQTDTMFLADEPQEVFYDSQRRSFRVNAPLQASISDEGRLHVKFFSPVGISDVTLMCRFNKFSPDFFELAHFDRIYPFMEASFPLPVTSSDCTFNSSSGRKVVIPAQESLSNDDVTIVIKTEDPFMKKIEQIDSRWFIRFSAYSADAANPGYWRHMNPLLCRHGVALALNMSFMFSSPDFNEEMQNYEGRLKDNGGNPINLDALRNRIRSQSGLILGRVTGVGGLGGGTTYGLADYCYVGVYFDATAPGSNPHNYPRQAMFHEFGHCLGYSHSSTMTYGDQWTVLCATVFVRMGSEGKLPVCSRNEVTGLPM